MFLNVNGVVCWFGKPLYTDGDRAKGALEQERVEPLRPVWNEGTRCF